MGDQLFEEWQVYEKLVTHDYMDHHAFFNRLQTEIVERFERPVAILDLGCGDLTPILPILATVPLRQYVGIDESDAALALASRRLQALRAPGRLIRVTCWHHWLRWRAFSISSWPVFHFIILRTPKTSGEPWPPADNT